MKIAKTLVISITVLLAMFLCDNAFAEEEPAEIKDASITHAVEVELDIDDAVSAHLVDVMTSEGIVTLDGQVDTVLGKERAEKIALATKGVRSVVNRLDVKPMERTDTQVKNDVITALAVDPATESYEVDVKVTDGMVTLEGTVQSWQEKQLSETVAKGVKGVKDVNNMISVNYKFDRPDAEIKKEVERKLDINVYVDSTLIDVSVDDGTVTLDGTVGSAAEKNRAVIEATVAGVTSVKDELEVKWWSRDSMQRKKKYVTWSDEKIKDAVKDAFLYDPRVLSFNPDIEVEDGVVTLSGQVADLKAKRAAEQDAEDTVGVWRVKNFLRVRPKDRPSDQTLKDRVLKALRRDPYVDKIEVAVVVLNGKVYLSGEVDSRFEKNRAYFAASGVSGVIEVNNNIDVDLPLDWKDDWVIREDIEDQLWWSTYVDSDDITVSVDKGVATLQGTVDSWFERRMAAQNAFEGGAVAVNNQLRIRNGSEVFTP